MADRKRVVITGVAGKQGRACVKELIDHGYDVHGVDRFEPAERLCPFIKADLTDAAQVLAALGGEADPPHAVVHLAAQLPRPEVGAAQMFANNAQSDHNVFEACRPLGVKHVVYASSETLLGLPFNDPPPYVPVDEAYPPRPNGTYSLCKLLAETMAQQFCRRDPQLKMIGLRFSNIMDPADYTAFDTYQDDLRQRKWNLWGYLDARDGAQAVRLAIESTLAGAHVYLIANADTVMHRRSVELLDELFPDVPRREIAEPHATLLSIDKARRELGYAPQSSWRDFTDV